MLRIDDNEITTLFFDVGNTLMSIDFELVRDELKSMGIGCKANTLRRAEAAARPVISSQIKSVLSDPSIDGRVFYFRNIIEKLPFETRKDISSIEQTAQKLVQVLYREGNSLRLWSYVLPGTHDALKMFHAMGFQMHVIGNADGVLEQQLTRSNLRSFFGVVIDSQVVGVEKPDPRIFNVALDTANCKPQEALYIGDIYEVDIVGARSVGMKAVLVDPFSNWKEVDCERIPDVLALAKKIKRAKIGT